MRKIILFLLFTMQIVLHVGANKKFSVWMAESEMKRYPSPASIDFLKSPRWSYAAGLELQSIFEISRVYGDNKFAQYATGYLDSLINEDGTIKGYKTTEHNIDHLNPGKLVFLAYKKTGEQKYKNTLQILRKQMETHPRTSSGSFWHKEIYTHQVWLDGLYMGAPFLLEYARTFDEPALIDEMVRQLIYVEKILKDDKTGLYYHGWDESKTQRWADPLTGRSPNFWSRSMGWYMMALVDALDYIPENHPQRVQVIEILKDISLAVERFRDPESGMWYQVTDKMNEKGNYLESSGSAMFLYTWVKGAQKGYLDKSYLIKGKNGFKQFVQTFLKKNPNGTISITNCCAVSGLGGSPKYRDGSFAYYISEPVRDNDAKTLGPFIYLCLMLKK